MAIIPTVAVNLDHNILRTILPLLENGRVGAIEWSYDALFAVEKIPAYFTDLLTAFARSQRLIGHGIFFSVCSAGWREEQASYLQHLRSIGNRFPMQHVTEHFGFFTGADFHRGAPISPPFTASLLRIARDRVARLQDAAGCPVGLENLALAYHYDDVLRQYAFLEALLSPSGGFLILDLHNLFCQAHNFGVAPAELLSRYPLHLVREIHVSGGSWEPHPAAPQGRVRRDTHDAAVPPEVFQLLREVIPRCPHLQFVTLEQLGHALGGDAGPARFRADYTKIASLCEPNTGIFGPEASVRAVPVDIQGPPITDERLAAEQALLSSILETSDSAATARERLLDSPLAASAWQIEDWEPHMLHTVWAIARKWR